MAGVKWSTLVLSLSFCCLGDQMPPLRGLAKGPSGRSCQSRVTWGPRAIVDSCPQTMQESAGREEHFLPASMALEIPILSDR